MKCPFCESIDSRVLESRGADDGSRVRRRRECCLCSKRFTTYEVIELTPILVIKKDGSREIFDSKKIFDGILKACHKRPIEINKLYEIARNIEMQLQNMLSTEIKSCIIGEKVMNILKDIDEVAYVRFASVYRQFKDISTFVQNLNENLI